LFQTNNLRFVVFVVVVLTAITALTQKSTPATNDKRLILGLAFDFEWMQVARLATFTTFAYTYQK